MRFTLLFLLTDSFIKFHLKIPPFLLNIEKLDYIKPENVLINLANY